MLMREMHIFVLFNVILVTLHFTGQFPWKNYALFFTFNYLVPTNVLPWESLVSAQPVSCKWSFLENY